MSSRRRRAVPAPAAAFLQGVADALSIWAGVVAAVFAAPYLLDWPVRTVTAHS